MTPASEEPQRRLEQFDAAAEEAVRSPRPLRLELPDTWESLAGEDRPESWGDALDEPRRLAEYEENRPPHHL